MLLSWLTNGSVVIVVVVDDDNDDDDDDDDDGVDDDDDDNEKQVSYIFPIVRMTSLSVPAKGLCMCLLLYIITIGL